MPATPSPINDTACGLPEALSATLSAAVRVPEAVGLNVASMLQLASAANELPQLLLSAKSPALVPVIEMLLIANVVVPTSVSVTALSELVLPMTTWPKFRLVGESFAVVPMPLRLTFCGLPAALSETLSAAVRLPEAVGLKEMLKLQLAP